MAKFKNTITGNIVSTTNAATIALMEKSATYEAVKGGKAGGAKDDKKSAEGADGEKSE